MWRVVTPIYPGQPCARFPGRGVLESQDQWTKRRHYQSCSIHYGLEIIAPFNLFLTEVGNCPVMTLVVQAWEVASATRSNDLPAGSFLADMITEKR